MSIRICTWNVKGSNNPIKRKAILNSLKKDKIQIAFLQETHLSDNEHNKYLREWVGQVYYSSYSTSKRGVIILIHKNLPLVVTDTYKDTEGRIILAKGTLYGEIILLGSIYSPNVNDDDFSALLFDRLVEMDSSNILIGGDFNCSLCPFLDRSPAQNTQSKSTRSLNNTLEEIGLVDIWRHLNPSTQSFTFHSLPHSSMSRIDYIFISRHLAHLVEKSDIGVIAISDHAPVNLVQDACSLCPDKWSFIRTI
uniref:exodeoxyribonuclease III n=1 Tax=Cyprinus carpio TaxID=7962 RepID=A0A8C1R9D1_CYPCA